MHIVISIFERPVALSNQDLIEKFRQSAPIYRDLEGLVSKHYLMGVNENNAGGVYVFKDRTAAEAWFTPEKIAWAEERFGPIKLQHFDVPIHLTTDPAAIHDLSD